uniref:UTP--glucose-1-phosphate uridylyltransferase n=1 Tax=Panagrolaimus sp. ES5 TaxID=591445 RepID=A0AC34F7M4_9BILA
MEIERKKELLSKIDKHLEKLVNDERSKKDIEIFRKLYEQFLTEPAQINWKSWSLPPEERYIDSTKLGKISIAESQELLKKLAVIRLNGGLGTSMGCEGPKSLINVKNDKTFLEIAIDQIELLNKCYEAKVPLFLMDSYKTLEETSKALKKFAYDRMVTVEQFLQSKCPRIYADSLLPVPKSADDELEGFYPPGHGNIFETLAETGLAEKLLEQGIEVLFVSNIDNTCATVDPRFIKALLNENREYIMEVTDKTAQDIKGGSLIEIDGRMMHLEMPQVPEEGIEEFCSTKTFKIFNTNNIWIDLKAIKGKLYEIKREIIANKKKLSNGREVIQLETSIGGAIRNFPNACALKVPRSRFLPVKRTQDLLLLASDAFEMDRNGTVKLVDPRTSAPIIHLIGAAYDSWPEFQKRVPHIPSLKDVDTLTIKGDVKFGKDVILKGNVHLEPLTPNEVLTIDEGVVIENNVDK